MTPGRLARWGLYVLAVWVIVALVITYATEMSIEASNVIGAIFIVIAALLLLGAGIAKVVQIGVRSAQDEEPR